MAKLEELLTRAFESTQQAFLTVIATGNAVREWQWYAQSRDTTMQLVNTTLGELEPFPIQFVFKDDPKWEGYSTFLEITRREKTQPPTSGEWSPDM